MQSSAQWAGLSSPTIEQVESLDCSLSPAPSGAAELSLLSLQHAKAQPGRLIRCAIAAERGTVTVLPSEGGVRVKIHVQDDLPMLPGDVVERMRRHGWRGRVLQIKGASVPVQWNRQSDPEWLARGDVYPLDREGRPRLPGQTSSIAEIARRARTVLESGESEGTGGSEVRAMVVETAEATGEQLRLF